MKLFKYSCMAVMLATLPLLTYAEDNGMGSASAPASVSDSAITSNVEKKLSQEPALKGISITVVTNQGLVSLSGTLQTSDQVDAAKKAAESISGVKDVDTSQLLKEEGGQPLTDAGITAKVKALFIKEKLFGSEATAPDMSIKVETKGGVVYLTGTTETKEQLDQAVRLAKSVKGVEKVDSKVVVGAAAASNHTD